VIRWIENVSRDAVRNGHHSEMGENAMLIQISDPPGNHPVPKHKFKEVHQFDFLDADDVTAFPEEALISQQQADELVRLLQHALDNSMNVLVHCHAGICRSGAVVEVGSMMGFTPTERFRMPNLRVKHFMMKTLGLTYDADEKASWTNGWVSESGIVMPNGDWE
jgi:rhodanese-related sulfurtransferase